MAKRLFVAGLPFSTTQDELSALFAQVGTVESAAVIIDKFSGRSKGFGFVEMATEEEAKKAIETLHETDFGGRKLIVAEAKPQEKREFSPRGGGRRDDDRRGGGGFGRSNDRGSRGGGRGGRGGYTGGGGGYR
jgi:RNA recognition motif-containing protein